MVAKFQSQSPSFVPRHARAYRSSARFECVERPVSFELAKPIAQRIDRSEVGPRSAPRSNSRRLRPPCAFIHVTVAVAREHDNRRVAPPGQRFSEQLEAVRRFLEIVVQETQVVATDQNVLIALYTLDPLNVDPFAVHVDEDRTSRNSRLRHHQ